MEPITYSLRAMSADRQDFRADLAALTDEFFVAGERLLGSVPDEYREWMAAHSRERLRSRGEYLFDILTFGILDRLYGARARVTSPVACRVLAGLYEARRRHRMLKPSIDTVRGVLATIFLSQESEHLPHLEGPVLLAMDRLIGWLAATGEYREEVKRIRLFRDWLAECPEPCREDAVASIHRFAGWFGIAAADRFGCYTAQVSRFLAEERPNHRWREDIMFCGRKEVEYHLGMLSIEVMNRAFAAAFDATAQKAVLLPACMRYHHDADCRARKVSLNMVCAECDDRCTVSRYTKLGRAHEFTVYIIPHSSDFTAWLETWAVDHDIGVVGVACLLNLITGGLELKSLNIPAQCVPLEYCGCVNHWHDTGVTTALAEDMLCHILGVSASPGP